MLPQLPADEAPSAISQLETQHREMTECQRSFTAAVRLDKPREEVRRLLETYSEVVGRNFASEERLMESTGYQELAAHVAAHRRLLGQLELVKNDLVSGAINPCGILALFVEAWNRQHSQGPDRLLAEHLKNSTPA